MSKKKFVTCLDCGWVHPEGTKLCPFCGFSTNEAEYKKEKAKALKEAVAREEAE